MVSDIFRALMIAGTHSGSGKTTICSGIIYTLKKRGYIVQPFKVGPDYIDPLFHEKVSGRASYNLDTWMTGEKHVIETFSRVSQDADFGVIEGVMGLFDGKSNAVTEKQGLFYGSSAHIAILLSLPVILIVDASSLAQSAGAIAYGFKHYMPELNLTGIIFNKVSGEKHFQMLQEGLSHCNVTTLGYIPRNQKIQIPERHLGLVSPNECFKETPFSEKMRELIEHHVNLDLLITKAKAIPMEERNEMFSSRVKKSAKESLNVALAYDEAFWFYYRENIDILQKEGIKILYFSPLNDTGLPENVDALYIGGGYPELYADKLSQNIPMLSSIRNYALHEGHIYAECGGLMYLTEGLYDHNGVYFKMVGVFKTKSRMKRGKRRLGYREVELKCNSPLGIQGEKLRGHEFHYSLIEKEPKNASEFYKNRVSGKGYRFKNTFASYIHIHFGCRDNIGRSFMKFIKK